MTLIFDDLVARTFQETTLLLEDHVFPAAILIRVVDQENFHAISTSGQLHLGQGFSQLRPLSHILDTEDVKFELNPKLYIGRNERQVFSGGSGHSIGLCCEPSVASEL